MLEEIEIVNRMSLLKCKEEDSQVSVTPECTRPAQTRLGTPKKNVTSSLGVGDPETLAKNLEDILSLLPEDGEDENNTPVLKATRKPRKPRLIEDIVKTTVKKVPKIEIAEDIHGNTISDGKPIKTMIVHTRAIGDRKYGMKETQDVDGKITDSKVLTEMSDIEIKKFEEDWKVYLIPTMIDAQIESGEFKKELKKLEDNEPTENIIIENSEAKEVQVESAERVMSPNDSNSTRKKDDFTSIGQEAETQVCDSYDTEVIEENATEDIVK